MLLEHSTSFAASVPDQSHLHLPRLHPQTFGLRVGPYQYNM